MKGQAKHGPCVAYCGPHFGYIFVSIFSLLESEMSGVSATAICQLLCGVCSMCRWWPNHANIHVEHEKKGCDGEVCMYCQANHKYFMD